MRRWIIGGGAAVALIAAGVAGSVLMASHSAPPRLELSAGQGSNSPGRTAGFAGRWTVAAGSQAGYRVKEKFINQPAETEAVARTSEVSGGMVVSIAGGTVKVTQMKFTVRLASLTSQDKYATYQVYQRDFFIRSIYLKTDSYPTATFAADSVTFAPPGAGPLEIDVKGKLMVHGFTKDVTAHVQAAQHGDSNAELAGSMSVDMRDFGIEVPDISFTRAEPEVTIEFDLMMQRAAAPA